MTAGVGVLHLYASCPGASCPLQIVVTLACCSRPSIPPPPPPPPALSPASHSHHPFNPAPPSPSCLTSSPRCPMHHVLTEGADCCRYELKLHGSCKLDSPCYSLATAPLHPDEAPPYFGNRHSDVGPQVTPAQAALNCSVLLP